jgi:hypothetical protein
MNWPWWGEPPQMPRRERDPSPMWTYTPPPRGCICPPGSEATCKGSDCPRQPAKIYTPEPKA